MVGTVRPLDWAVFGAVVLLSLLLDRAVFGGPKATVSFREASIRSIFFVLVGLGFSVYVYAREGVDAALTYLLAYVVEESLSVDNVRLPGAVHVFPRDEAQQQRVLVWASPARS